MQVLSEPKTRIAYGVVVLWIVALNLALWTAFGAVVWWLWGEL